MKCPLMGLGNWPTGHKLEFVLADCLREKCAWWDPANGCCAPIALNQILVAIGNVLGRIHTELTSLKTS